VPYLLRDILEDAIAREPDMVLIDGDGSLETLVGRSAADVAIVITDEGRTAQVLEFRRRLLPDVSPQVIVRAIRDAAGNRAKECKP
jgi:CO dehydrogenase nickel-insertion accessory protein CooC1